MVILLSTVLLLYKFCALRSGELLRKKITGCLSRLAAKTSCAFILYQQQIHLIGISVICQYMDKISSVFSIMAGSCISLYNGTPIPEGTDFFKRYDLKI